MSISQISPDPVRRNSLSNVKITSQLRKKSVTRMVSVSSDSNLAASSVLFDDIKIDDDDADVFQSPVCIQYSLEIILNVPPVCFIFWINKLINMIFTAISYFTYVCTVASICPMWIYGWRTKHPLEPHWRF